MAQPAHPVPHHHIAVLGSLGALHLDLRATLASPWTVLFGPSGCGKSTVLRSLVGLEPHLATTLTRTIGTSAENFSDRSPEQRQLAYAPQQAALFPHLTARENIAFPLQVRRAAQTVLPDLLHLLHLEPLQHRRPHQLSGGERQRVALARALAVPTPQLLLLDEPFAGVDRALRDQLLPPLRAWLTTRGIPVLSVTHDVDEALLLQAEVLRLHDGRNRAQGPAHEVLAPEIARLRTLIDGQTPNSHQTGR